MERVLVLLHTDADGSVGKAGLEAIGAAKGLGSAFDVGLVGGAVEAAAAQIGGCGAEKFLCVADERFAQPRYSSDAAAAEALAKASGAPVILAAHTSRWARVLPGVSHRIGGRCDTHVTSLALENGGLKASRWYYRQRMEGSFTRTQRPWILLLESGVAESYSGAAAAVQPAAVEAQAAFDRTRVEGIEAPQLDQQTIRPDAEVLFVAGAGWTKKQKDGSAHPAEAAELILGFLGRANASLGSSKSLVDMSGEGEAVLPFLTHMNQVGQTGATPRHPKGLATCCHGEEPHVVGWRFVNERRAVNLDANCGWARGKADVLYVADAFEVMRKANELLGSNG